MTSPITGSGTMPYTYSFDGTPGYSGLDCCTWHLDSESGTLGTGQLIFFHNLDTGNPANMPPDTDLDGIRDLCDNCPAKANGPLLGSCLTGPSAGALVLAGAGARGGRRRQSSPSRLPAARSAAAATSRSGSLVSQRR